MFSIFSSGRRPSSPALWTVVFLALLFVVGPSPSHLAAEAPMLPSHVPDANVERSAVPEIYHWKLSQLFPSDAAWEEARVSLAGQITQLAAFEGQLEEPAALRKALELYFSLHDRINHVTLFANLKLSTDRGDNEAQAMQQNSLLLLDDLMGEASFLRAEILAMEDSALESAFLAEPALEIYRPYLENIVRRRSRKLPLEAERVLSLVGDNLWAEIDLNEIPSASEDTFGALMGDIPWPTVHDEQGNEVQLTLANFGRFRASKNREVRKEAVEAFFATLRQFENTLAATLAGQFEFDVALARARGYDRAIEAYLDKDGLSPAVIDNLVSTINDNLEPLHRYVELRKKALGLDDLHLYDLYVPMVADVDVELPFPEARETILSALKPLGDDYSEVLATSLDPKNGWMDLYPSLRKQSGAFSASVYGRHPYLMMNYQDSYDDMSTLAHELGHALHSHLAMQSQPYSSYRYVPFLAEVASTCNEVILSDYLVDRAEDKAQKIALLTERAENIRTTIYRQTLFTEFERLVHGFVEDGVPVTADLLNESYAELVRRYYGPGFTVDDNDGVEWAYIPHFYYKYYVYSYATGLSSGIAIAEKVRNEGPEAVAAYLEMLEGGSSKPPLELLRGAGVDLTRPDAIEAAARLFEQTLVELEKLL